MLYAMRPSAAKKQQKRGGGRAKKSVLLQIKVDGPGIQKGRIPVPDLIRICQEMQNAVNRQAEAIEGRNTIHPGPIAARIQQECTLDLVRVGDGSAVLDFELSKPQQPLFDEATSLATEAVSELASTIK